MTERSYILGRGLGYQYHSVARRHAFDSSYCARVAELHSHPMLPMGCRGHALLSRRAAGSALESLCEQVNLYINLM